MHRCHKIENFDEFSDSQRICLGSQSFMKLQQLLQSSTWKSHDCFSQFSNFQKSKKTNKKSESKIQIFLTCSLSCFFSCLKVTKVGLKVLKVPLSTPPSPPPPSSVKCKISSESAAMHRGRGALLLLRREKQFKLLTILTNWSYTVSVQMIGVIQFDQSSFNFCQISLFTDLKFYNSDDDLLSRSCNNRSGQLGCFI